MTLNSEGLEAACRWFAAEFNGLPNTETLTAGIVCAYLSALPPVDGLEVVAWDVAPKGLPAEPTKSHSFVAEIEKQGGVITPLVSLSQASSVIAGLKEANEALMRERTSLIETKREQIERLTKERDEAVDNGHDWFNVSQDRMERISSLEEENKRLREERDEVRRGEYAANEHEPTWDEITSVWKARAETAEQEAKALLDALNQGGLTPEQKSWVESFLKTRAFLSARQAMEDHNG